VSGLLLDLINAGPEDDTVRTADVQSIISKFNGHPDSGGPWSFLNDLDQEVFAGDAAGVYATPDGGTHAPTRVLVDQYDLAVGMLVDFEGTVLGNLALYWHVCDGTGGTNDLRDRFMVAGGTTYAVGSAGGSATVNLNHSHSHAHTMGHSHSHTHGVGSYTGPSHAHGTSTITTANHTHAVGPLGVGGATGTSPEATNSVQSGSGATVNPTNHTHTNGTLDVTGTIGPDGGGVGVGGNTDAGGTQTLSGGVSGSDATGSSAANTGTDATAAGSASQSIVPPYYSVTKLRKVA
jgi:hypothetical protein